MAKTTAETIIAHGVRLEGDFVSEGDVTIEGEVSGTVKTGANLIIGDKAVLRANVSAKSATISGEVRGNLTVEDRLDLKETSKIVGDVSANVLSVGAGAQINGKLTMGEVAPLEHANEMDDSEDLDA
jgi:cytoskeletal protein CcmA (bactofilin family)